MTKVDAIYVFCNRQDSYFANICVASIRYWNNYTPIYLVKDFSKGSFDTTDLEKHLGVTVRQTDISSLGYFAKLYPLIEKKEDRIVILDADIVWMCDLVPLLEKYDEDIIADGYSPEDIEAEKQRWYFFEPSFSEHFQDYVYPGFFFNVGQLLINTKTFSKDDFADLIYWQENPSAKVANTFFYEQGILNYLVAKKIADRSISYKNVHFHLWGWDDRVAELTPGNIKEKKSIPFLIHWYGVKNGLISFLPGNKILMFYENFYYKSFRTGNFTMLAQRFKRSVLNLDKFMYGILKKIYYRFIPNSKKA